MLPGVHAEGKEPGISAMGRAGGYDVERNANAEASG
jgi:hypothetical protein